MSMEYIRSYYGVPAKRGARVEYRDGPGYVKYLEAPPAVDADLQAATQGDLPENG